MIKQPKRFRDFLQLEDVPVGAKFKLIPGNGQVDRNAPCMFKYRGVNYLIVLHNSRWYRYDINKLKVGNGKS